MSLKRIFRAYKDLIGTIYAEAPVMVVITVITTFISGLVTPLGVYVNQNVFDGGLAVANNELAFAEYAIFLVLFVILAILPSILDAYIYTYVEQRSILIVRTAFKSRLLQKLKTMKYEHFENEASAEIIDKAYNRIENSARHLWPIYTTHQQVCFRNRRGSTPLPLRKM